MLRRLSVRGKILAALAVPILALFVAAVVLSIQAISDSQDAGTGGLTSTRALLTIGVAAVVIVLSIVIAVVVAKSIVTPLRRLTGAAERVRDQLPVLVQQVAVPGQSPSINIQRIPVESSDEVGHLATAFNDVNAMTLGVASEQAALRGSIAEMFVNVARRDQVLLNRQLTFLDELERAEEDPNALSNLFRLDHLATRMRRNAESLLVLAGIDSGRRVRQPMPASDVVRTASSEIELFDRVRLRLTVDPLMLGHNALMAAHLLAELLENATMFSEPHTPVEVTTSHEGDFVQIKVRDHGLGMSPEELADVNRRVTSRSATDVVGSQRLGLYVVARLAERLSARVSFMNGPDGVGTEAVVDLPLVLFVPDSSIPLPDRSTPVTEGGPMIGVPGFENGYSPVEYDEETVLTPRTGAVPLVPMPLEEQAPTVREVDIAALTDGTTGTGMPRRRSRGMDSETPAPASGFAAPAETGAIVLPPLATPSFPLDMPGSDDTWAPPAEIATGGALPSRHRTETSEVPLTAEPTEAPVLDVNTRAALFSNFRPMDALESADVGNPVALGAAPAVSASDVSGVGYTDEGTWTPQMVVDTPAPPAHGTDQTQPMQQVPDDATVRSSGANTELPAFDDLMTDLPTRREMRDAPATRKRGRFGRKRDGEDSEGDFSDLTPAAGVPGILAMPEGVPGYGDPGYREPGYGEPGYDEPGLSSYSGQELPDDETQLSAYMPSAPVESAYRPQAYAEPDNATSYLEPNAPATYQGDQTTLPERAPMYGLPDEATVHLERERERPVLPTEPPTVTQEYNYLSSQVLAAPLGDRGQLPSEGDAYGPPSPLQRRPLPEPLEPLDPGYISDSVEAHSEWVASAVLRDEVTALLHSGADYVAARDAGDLYEPVHHETGPGLTRRARVERDGYVDRFTARIERDPEQLRARLAAFQSATARGRAEVEDGRGNNDHVPDSAPQAR